MTTLLALLGLKSPDPLVPCKCTGFDRIKRHIGNRNYYYMTGYNRWLKKQKEAAHGRINEVPSTVEPPTGGGPAAPSGG